MESLLYARNWKASGWFEVSRGATTVVHHHAIHRHLVLKVAFNGHEQVIDCEYNSLQRLRNMSVRPERIPWADPPFQLRLRMGPVLGRAMLQARLEGQVLNMTSAGEAYAALSNSSHLAARVTLVDAMDWEAVLRKRRVGIANLHFVRKRSGQLWIIEPECDAVGKYQYRQSLVLSSTAMSSALRAYAHPTVRKDATCMGTLCQMSCVFIHTAPGARDAIRRSGNDRALELLARMRRMAPAHRAFDRRLHGCSGCERYGSVGGCLL